MLREEKTGNERVGEVLIFVTETSGAGTVCHSHYQ